MPASGLKAVKVGGIVALSLILLLRAQSLQGIAQRQGDAPFTLKWASALAIVHWIEWLRHIQREFKIDPRKQWDLMRDEW